MDEIRRLLLQIVIDVDSWLGANQWNGPKNACNVLGASIDGATPEGNYTPKNTKEYLAYDINLAQMNDKKSKTP